MLTRFYLGTSDPSWIGRSPVPLMVSAERPTRSWARRPALNGWACDSGGYMHVNRHGRWTRSAAEHVELVRERVDRCPGLDWAAPQDWMCEPHVLAKTGLTVVEHQKRTVANFLKLRDLAPEINWIPVLQGYGRDEYYECWRLYEAEGLDLRQEPLVGVGSVCRRQNTLEIELLFYNLWKDGLRCHGFGVKLQGLDDYAQYLHTADSQAWSVNASWRPAMCGSDTHKHCSGCFVYAHMWYDKLTERQMRWGRT